MFDVQERPELVRRALLVGVYFEREEEAEAADLLAELRELVETLGIGIAGEVLNRVRDRTTRFLTGSGKAREIIDQAQQLEADCIIFDNELTPAQQRAWESESGIAVIDRHEVILDIFDRRARTREARLQVDLARFEYSLPRLKRMWVHLDRQGGTGGGGGATAARGEGETQLEVDRRLARDRISRLRAELDQVRQQRTTQRKERTREQLPHIAIVGYTNAGKSSLLNRLTGADVLVEDKLFATLDTTTRRVSMPDGQQAVLTDTVGFVRKLPHDLIESFKATLEEAVNADLLVHVLDASHPRVYRFYETTNEVLRELGAGEKRRIVALNKIDLVTDPAWRAQLDRHFHDAIFLSAKTGEGLNPLLHRLNQSIYDRVVRLTLRIPMARSEMLAVIHREGKIISQEFEGNDALVTAIIPRKIVHLFHPFQQVPHALEADSQSAPSPQSVAIAPPGSAARGV